MNGGDRGGVRVLLFSEVTLFKCNVSTILSPIAGPIEFNVSGTGEEYLDLARTQLYVKAKITKANGTALDADTQVGPVNLFLHSLFSHVDVSLNERLISPSTNTYPYRAMLESLLNYGEEAKTVNFLWLCFTKILLER